MAEDHLQDEDKLATRLDVGLWRKTLVFSKPYRGHMLALVILALLAAGVDMTLPLLTGRIIDQIRVAGKDAHLLGYGLMYAGSMTVLGMCIFTFIILAGRITTGVSYDIRTAAFAKLQELPFSFYDRKAVGWLMARLTSDCGSLSHIMGWALLDMTWGSTLVIAITVSMLMLNWKLALLVLTIVPVLAVVSRWFQVRLLKTNRALRKANSHTTAAFNEGIVGVRTTRSMVREGRNLEEFRELTGTMYRHAVANALYSVLLFPALLSVCSIGVAIALWRGGVDVSLGGMSLGTLIAFVQYANLIQHPVQEFANAFTQVQAAQASAERIQQLLSSDPEIVDSPEVRALMADYAAQPNKEGGLAPDGLPDEIGRIEFRNVSFAYKEGQKVLDGFNLTVKAGQTIALVGPTGGGKTTIVGLLCRFYEPSAGEVLIDGVDYRRRSLRWLQSNLGIVLQQPHLFSGTIRDNIRYGRLDATDAEVEEAARLVNAHGFIAAMKDGYNSQVGEGGNQLSTGQKQLIAMARAILANPRIFVMDEATSSVDTVTERAIQSAVERILANRISFVIAHRLSTIRSADRILVIAAGKIAESGTHHELLKQRGHYYELYTSQFTHEHEDEVLHYEPVVEQAV